MEGVSNAVYNSERKRNSPQVLTSLNQLPGPSVISVEAFLIPIPAVCPKKHFVAVKLQPRRRRLDVKLVAAAGQRHPGEGFARELAVARHVRGDRARPGKRANLEFEGAS